MESKITTCVRLQYFGIKEIKIKVYKYFIFKEVQQKIILKKDSKLFDLEIIRNLDLHTRLLNKNCGDLVLISRRN
jgi:hypothetical protein